MHSGKPENWAAIPGYDYQVSDRGRVRCVKTERIMQAGPNMAGYINVSLQKDGGVKRFYVHRLVAAAFIRPMDAEEVVNHINFCRSDNDLGNLEIVTRQQNSAHAHAAGRYASNGRNSPKGEDHLKAKLTCQKVIEIRAAYEKGENTTSLGRKYGVSRKQVHNVINRVSWAHV